MVCWRWSFLLPTMFFNSLFNPIRKNPTSMKRLTVPVLSVILYLAVMGCASKPGKEAEPKVAATPEVNEQWFWLNEMENNFRPEAFRAIPYWSFLEPVATTASGRLLKFRKTWNASSITLSILFQWTRFPSSTSLHRTTGSTTSPISVSWGQTGHRCPIHWAIFRRRQFLSTPPTGNW